MELTFDTDTYRSVAETAAAVGELPDLRAQPAPPVTRNGGERREEPLEGHLYDRDKTLGNDLLATRESDK